MIEFTALALGRYPVVSEVEVVLPLPDGAAQVPSPRQKVVFEADVPPLRSVTGI
jgi:hypothetical protein